MTAAIAAGKPSATVHLGATTFIGVQVVSYAVQVPGNPARAGAGVVAVTASSPAAAAGVQPFGVIVSVGGQAVDSAMSLRSVMDAYHPGDKAMVRWVDQAGHAHAATVVFTVGPAGSAGPVGDDRPAARDLRLSIPRSAGPKLAW